MSEEKIKELENKINMLENRIRKLEGVVAIALISGGLYIIERFKQKTEEKEGEKK